LRQGRPARRQINQVWHRPRPSSFTHCSRPANDRFLPRAYSPVSDPAVLGKSSLCSYCTHSHASLVFFKQQHVARPHPQRLADGKGHGNSAFRRNLRAFFQCQLSLWKVGPLLDHLGRSLFRRVRSWSYLWRQRAVVDPQQQRCHQADGHDDPPYPFRLVGDFAIVAHQVSTNGAAED
jgi:hypothetical protein